MPLLSKKHRVLNVLVLTILMGGVLGNTPHIYASSWSPTLIVNTEAFQVIDDSDSTSDLYIQFGGSLNKRLTYDRTIGTFLFDDDLEVVGTASGRELHAQDKLTSSGQLVIEANEAFEPATVFVDQNANGSGQLIDSESADHAALLLDIEAATTNSAGATVNPHIYFGYNNIFDTNLFRQKANTLYTDDDLWIGETASGARVHAQDRLTSSGTLAVENSFFGAGLSDCDNATSSKLLWNADDGTFSCGTDQDNGGTDTHFSGTGSLQAFFDNRYVEIGGDMMTGSLTINDESGAAQGLLVQNVAKVQVNTTDFSYPHFKIENSSGNAGTNYTDSTRMWILHRDSTIESGQEIGSIEFNTTDSNLDDISGVGSGAAIRAVAESTNSIGLNFNVRSSTTINGEVMRLTSDGKLGIGTTAPDTKLEVVGAISGSILTMSSLKNCDTLDTDANGTVSCGTDDSGGGFSGTGSLQAFFDNRYVETAGDTMTGALTIDNEGSEPSLNVRGTASGSALFAQNSISTSGSLVITTEAVIGSSGDEGPNAGGSATSDNTVGTGGDPSWSNPSNALASDDIEAVNGTDYGENEYSIRLYSGGTYIGDNKSTGAALSYSEATYTYGASDDNWGTSLVGSDVNNSGFGVGLAYQGSAGITEYLRVSDFGFSLPSSVEISGIIVTADVSVNGAEVWPEVDYVTMRVYYNDESSSASIIRVADGKIGIGTASAEEELEVVGTASGTQIHAQDRLTSSGTLAVENSFFGAGLTDCDNATSSKLLWNADDGTFSCGTDQDNGGTDTHFSGTGALQAFFDNRYVETAGDTMTGALTIDNEGSEPSLNVRGTASGQILHAQDSLTSSGSLVVEGNLTFGDAITDTITVNAQFISSLLPNADDTYDLGSSEKRWRDVYVGPASLHIGTDGNEAQIGYDTTGNEIEFDADDDGTPEVVFEDGGNVGIGTEAPNAKLDVVGTLSGASLTVSDLQGCDTIDTDAQGNLSCGTDDDTDTHFSGTGALQTAFDNRYVETGGDTMTGALLIQTGSTALTLSGASVELKLQDNRSMRLTRSDTNDTVTMYNSLNVVSEGSYLIYDTSGTTTVPSVFTTSTQPFAISAWVNTNTTGSTQYIFDSYDGSSAYVRLYVNANNTVSCQRRHAGGGTRTTTSSDTLSVDTWHHVVCTRDGYDGKIYIDSGTPASSSFDTTAGAGNGGPEYIGSTNAGANGFSGLIDDVRLYTATLNSSTVGTLYSNGRNAATDPGTNLQSWYLMDEGTGTDVADNSGNANDGTTSGTTWASGATEEVTIFSSTVSAAAGIYGTQTFGDSNGDTHIKGNTLSFFSGDGTEYGQFNTDGMLEIFGTASGAHLHAQDSLTSSGTLVIDGAVTLGNLTNCDTIDTDANGVVSCGTDDDTHFSGTGALQTAFDNRYVETGGDTMTGALLIQTGSTALTLSGSSVELKLQDNRSMRLTRSNTNDTVTMYNNINVAADGSHLIYSNTSDVLTVPSIYTTGTSTWAISAWVNTNTTGSTQYIFDSYDGSSAYVRLYVNTNNTVGCTRRNAGGSTRTVTSTDTLSVDTWHHVVCTRSGYNGIIYIDNGTPKSGSLDSGNGAGNGGSEYIGNTNTGSNGFSGLIDDVRLYTATMDASTVGTLYANGRNADTDPGTNLQSWYLLDEGTGTDAADSSGNSNDGTVSGATWAAGTTEEVTIFSSTASASAGIYGTQTFGDSNGDTHIKGNTLSFFSGDGTEYGQFNTDGMLEIFGTASGAHLHAQDSLTSSGTLVIETDADKTVVFSNNTDYPTYNALTFNGDVTDDGAMGIFGGATGDGNMYIQAQSDLRFRSNGNNTRMVVEADGDVGIGDTEPAYKLEIGGGDVNTTGGGYRDAGSCVAGTCASDRTLKENIEPITGALAKLKSINPSTFTFKDEHFGPGKQYGLIAQEVEEVLPELVEESADGYKTVKYGMQLQMLTMAAAKEIGMLAEKNLEFGKKLSARLDDFESQLAELKSDIEELQERLPDIEGNGTILSVSEGTISINGTYHIVESEDGDKDTLANIEGGTLNQTLVLQAAPDHKITVRKTGKLLLSGGDYVLDKPGDVLVLLKVTDDMWVELSRTGGSGNVHSLNGAIQQYQGVFNLND